MRNDNIVIRKRNSSFLPAGLVFLGCLVAGLFVAALRFLPFGPKEDPLRLILTIAGASVAAVGLIGYVVSLIRGVRQKDALIITNKGFTNLLIGGKEGVYVEWIQVRSLRIFGLRKSPMLGISLADEDGYLQSLTGKDLREAEYNRSIGLPVIAIAQKDVKTSVDELKNTFSRMVKGAISWENYMRQEKRREDARMAQTSSAGTEAQPASEVSRPRTEPERTEFKTFAERRQEAEARAAAERSASGKRPSEGIQAVLFPDTGETPVYGRKSETSPRPSLFGDDPDEEPAANASEPEPEIVPLTEAAAGLSEEDVPEELPEEPYDLPEEDDDVREYVPHARPTEDDSEPEGAGVSGGSDGDGDDDNDDDDEILELEDDEDPVPVDMPKTGSSPAANPFAAFDKPGAQEGVTILDIEDD